MATNIADHGGFAVSKIKLDTPDHPKARYGGLNPHTTTLPVGYNKDPSRRAFDVETVFEKDIEIPMRDGVKIRGDVWRPAGKMNLPAIIMWGPYGKSGQGAFSLDIVETRVGVLPNATSGFENFEGLDPAEWVNYDYAILNIDTRGAFDSEGDLNWWGTSEGRDGYDTVEFIAQQSWCNGRVAFAGNSWLAASQWFIAAERPPHLTCIMPLEGLSDLYRETLCRGGVPNVPFLGLIRHLLFGKNKSEDPVAMVEKYPLWNDYWADKRAKVHLIECPVYALASMSTFLHTMGSLRGFEEIPHDKKWLRVHPTQEWNDLYSKETVVDLKKFVDFYMKDVPNDWEQTPKARISVLRYNQPPLKNIPFSQWPIPQTQPTKLYLSSNNTLQPTQSATVPGTLSYDSSIIAQQTDSDPEELSFTHTFTSKTTLIGNSKVVLHLSCPSHDDLDVFVILRKADKTGTTLRNSNIPLEQLHAVVDTIKTEQDIPLDNPHQYIGPTGILRASHRALDEKLSKPHWAAHDHTREHKVPPGEIVKLEIGIWFAAIQFEAGEKLVLRVSGHDMRLAEFPPLRGKFVTGNKGVHEVHVGGQYESFVEFGVVDVDGLA